MKNDGMAGGKMYTNFLKIKFHAMYTPDTENTRQDKSGYTSTTIVENSHSIYI